MNLWNGLKAASAIAAIAWYLMPRRSAKSLIEMQSEAMSMMLRSALGTESPSYPPPKPFTGLRPEDEAWLRANGWNGDFPMGDSR